MFQGGKTIGRWGETQACSFLERKGFVVIDQNYHTTTGEIDIVARKNDEVYFIEVKTRRAGPMAYDLAVTPEKQRRLRRAVSVYCYRRSIRTSIVLASLMVIVNKRASRVAFRMAVLF
ncbi:MAG: hypothetical protein A3I29_01505 [Candidatus Magasanikbacteria bacterium RIFCSPLOWO2_02_FULL_44_11]|uniref:UPF0102 protein A3I29_01505 n=2 Tax=Candidatus Magasanikiibacteriota TaxID=1752731 RepID=A0A1F6NAE1_9BACT|nr:MAG: hypothetical protein A3D53_00075 [Candidatus Magasanikbacteria bacterium RIFCSPHIGHO2_02_FULL_45_10]OGH80758.1 MAG: hypothetical protein A3I29_01505 [Candidatus Magasanikbacteria bacterium RIFCSPLOWO2_02_FULL_44_11]